MVSQAVYTSYTLKNDPATNPLDKLPPILKKNLDRNLCTCNEVLKMDIINAIVEGATTVGEIKKQTYATMGTGCCTKQVERLIECLCSPGTLSESSPGTPPEAPPETEK